MGLMVSGAGTVCFFGVLVLRSVPGAIHAIITGSVWFPRSTISRVALIPIYCIRENV